MQNFRPIAEIFRGTMRDAKSGLRNESDWSKNKQTRLHFLELLFKISKLGTRKYSNLSCIEIFKGF